MEICSSHVDGPRAAAAVDVPNAAPGDIVREGSVPNCRKSGHRQAMHRTGLAKESMRKAMVVD